MSWRTPANLAWLEGLRGVQLDHPLARHTSFNIGGPADFFVATSRPEAVVGSAGGGASRTCCWAPAPTC